MRLENEVTAKDDKEQEGLDIPGVAAAVMDKVCDCDAAQDMDIMSDASLII